MRAYEIHTYRDGVWKVDSVFDDKDLAIFEARRVEEGSRYAGVKVIEEYYDEASDLTTTRTLFRGGAAKARRPLPEKPKPKPGRGVPRGSAGSLRSNNRRRLADSCLHTSRRRRGSRP